jgi:hypothetical protein
MDEAYDLVAQILVILGFVLSIYLLINNDDDNLTLT